MSPRGPRTGAPARGHRGPPPSRRRPRSLDRPVSLRIYRAAWALAAVPLLAAAFSVVQPDPLPAPRLEPSFDQATAVAFTAELARQYPDRTPGSVGGIRAADWVAERFEELGLRAHRDTFTADLPPLGETQLVNVLAIAPGQTPETLLVLAHRDNSGTSPGANDNASGTGALLELARTVETAQLAHTIAFLSTDGGAFGGVGAARFAERPDILRRILGTSGSVLGVLNLDGIASGGEPYLVFSGDAARTPAGRLLATTADSVLRETGRQPGRPSALAQLVALGFPLTLHEQGPFVARGIPAVTLTTGGERVEGAGRDTVDSLARDQLGTLGRAAQDLLLRLDQSPNLARATQSYVYVGDRLVRGWAVQLLLLAALLPFLAATVDLFARCRRRHVALRPALRSLASRTGVALWTALLLAAFAVTGLLVDGEARPLNPDSAATREWPVAALVALAVLAGAGWLLAYPRLAPRRPASRREELGGHLAAMLALALVALVVAATNPYSLLFLLPSLHAWLWLPHVPRENVLLRGLVFVAGLAGPAVLVGSLAYRLGLGLDTLWYLLALVAVGYVAPALVLAALVWAAAAAQVGALAFGRYVPYPPPDERPARGPIREGIRRVVLFSRARRAARQAPDDYEEAEP